MSNDRIPFEQRFSRPSVMGIVNVTPDSFSDGGVHLDAAAAVSAARLMVEEGAAIVDVGGESTRPGSARVALAEELRQIGRASCRERGENSVVVGALKIEDW